MSRHIRTYALVLAVATWLSGCDGIFGPDSDRALEYVVERFEVIQEDVDWSPIPIAYLIAEIGIVNTGSESTTTGFSLCDFHLEAFATDAAELPVWRSPTHTSWPMSTHIACTLADNSYHIGPGDTLSILATTQPLAGILADSLPAGSYDFRATLGVDPGPVHLDFGTITVPTSRHPLPDRVAHRDGFRYEVEIEDIGAGSTDEAIVKLHVAYSASSLTRALERELVSECPVRLLAFREATEVTTIPVPEPVWSWPESCPPGDESVTLNPGESRSFERRLDPEQVAGIAGPGRYHLMGIIEVDGRAIRLSAGEVSVPQ